MERKGNSANDGLGGPLENRGKRQSSTKGPRCCVRTGRREDVTVQVQPSRVGGEWRLLAIRLVFLNFHGSLVTSRT